jgi:DNA invertase Pin-like site-specific DNA recombinase
MMAVLAEFERDQVSERTATAMAHKKAKGERFSRYRLVSTCQPMGSH